MKSTPEYITAIAALTKIVEIKKFSSLEDYSYLVNIPLVQEINNKAKQEIAIDLFENKDSNSLAKYTSFLNKQINDDILSTENIAGIGDEVELLNNIKHIPSKSLSEYKLEVHLTKHKGIENEHLRAFNLTKPNIISLVRNADYVQEIKVSQKTGKIFLVSTKAQIRSKECIILFILMEADTSKSVLSLDKRLLISNVYFFNPANSRLSSPARLFIQMLDKYGRAVTLGFKTQRFFYNGIITGVYDVKELDKMFSQKFNLNYAHGGIRRTPLGLEYYFFYTIDIEKFISDIKRLSFI